MKRCAVIAAKSAFRGIFRNRTQSKHFLTLALAFGLCGLFYSLNLPTINTFHLALAKDEKNEQKEDIICGNPLPKASLTDPSFEIYKLEVLCENPEKKITEAAPKPIEQEEVVDPKEEAFKEELLNILEGTPMEKMIEPISKQNKTVAAFLVGIAFKESKFGVYSPVDNQGNHCYNYWGFKGKTNPQRSGYSCFSSPEEAVEIVGKRLENLAIEKNLNTPARMTVWKCGSSCATHSPESVSKWISDVSIYFYPLSKS